MQLLKQSARPVPEQISELRDNYPHSLALSQGDRQLDYEEFNRRADHFAGYLVQLGIVSGSTVAISMERSFDWIVAALGIMRAGAAYVPLDSSWPDSRLHFAVKDSGATVLVARAALLDRFKGETLGIDPCRDAAIIAAAPAMSRPVQPESLAYVIYTSGSTGVPKGVEITHANLSHLIRWHREAFSVTRQDRASHLAGLGFDAAAWEIWPHLAAGATVCLADDAVRSSPELLQKWLISERVTISFVPTVHATPMIAMEWPATTALRTLLTGGDVLHLAPHVQLPFEVVNNYGPTECTVVSTSGVLKPGSDSRPTIGRPITGTSVYLLNEQGEQVPDGTRGEIYIGGGAVGRGYRNLPDSTERSFLPDPFAKESGARMYRTGDQGVRRPDGEIEFHGRLDRQAKIRGHRIELDEIATVLNRHPSIDFATAIAHTPDGGESRLVAYVLPKENVGVPTVSDLQKHLLRSLPDYMVPAMYVRLHELPLSPNGKLDLKMLAQPTEANMLKRATPKTPSTPIKEKLLGIVREVLKNDATGEEDNFFLAGGHSLLGMQLLTRLRSAFGVDLTVQQLFGAPTVESLALLVTEKLAEQRLAAIWTDLLGTKNFGPDANFFDAGGNAESVAILQQRIAVEFGKKITLAELSQNPTIRRQIELIRGVVKENVTMPPGVLALHPQGTRNGIFWVHYLSADLAKAMGEDQPFFHVGLTPKDMESLGKAPLLQNIAACFIRKILAASPKGPYVIGGYCLGGMLSFEIASQMQASGYEVPVLFLLDTPSPFYFESPHLGETGLSRPGYLLKRLGQLGLWMSFAKVRERLSERYTKWRRTAFPRTEAELAQKMIEAAASRYQPEKYDGKVVLLLASEHHPHANFLPEWQALVPGNLHTQYVQGSHTDLTKEPMVSNVAKAMASHLKSAADKKSFPCGTCNR